MTIIDRVKKIIEHEGISTRQFCIKIGAANGFLDKVKDIGSEKVSNILYAYPEISPEWLLTGNGEMLKEDNNKIINAEPSVSDLFKAVGNLTEIMKMSAEIERIKAEAHAESIRLNAEIEKEKAETERIKAESSAESIRLNAENEKLKLENERLNAQSNDRNSKTMEYIISSLLASGKTPHEKKRTTSENSP